MMGISLLIVTSNPAVLHCGGRVGDGSPGPGLHGDTEEGRGTFLADCS